MTIQVLRFSSADASALGRGRLAQHTRGERRSAHTAIGARAGAPAVELIPDRDSEGLALIARDRAARVHVSGRRPGGVVDCMVAGPPRYDSPDAWDPSRVLAWARDCAGWLESRLPPGALVAHACLHLDEAAPHVHIAIVPFDAEAGRVNWARCRSVLAGWEPASRLKGRDASRMMTVIQDRFHADVSARYGLDRGEKGSRRTHREVDRRIAAERERETAEAEAAAAKARADEADREAAKAAARRERAEAAAAAAKATEARADRDAIASRERAAEEHGRANAEEARLGELRMAADVLDADVKAGRLAGRAKTGRRLRTGIQRAEAERERIQLERDQARAERDRVCEERDRARAERDKALADLELSPLMVKRAKEREADKADAWWRPRLEESTSALTRLRTRAEALLEDLPAGQMLAADALRRELERGTGPAVVFQQEGPGQR